MIRLYSRADFTMGREELIIFARFKEKINRKTISDVFGIKKGLINSAICNYKKKRNNQKKKISINCKI